MFDAQIRANINPALDKIAARMARAGITANGLTLSGALFGVAAAILIADGQYGLALIFIAINRLFDGLDGRIAGINGSTEFGGYLDSLCDFLFYVAVPLGFGIANPANLLPALILVAAFTLTGVSFLAFAAIAARRGEDNGAHGRKSLIYSTGLMEGAETIAFFVVMCLLPDYFPGLAYVFAGLCALTVLQRVWMAANLLGR
jgi:phosphatidylglycerophosphate synthase